jgi:hypothetical protein
MGAEARRQMDARSWDGVFDAVYQGYRQVLAPWADAGCEGAVCVPHCTV